MNLFETHYTRWTGTHTSLWHRRLTIAIHGMNATLQGKLMKWLIGTAWSASAMVCVLLFLVGQILVPENILMSLGEKNEDFESIIKSMFYWLDSNPDISVSTIYNLVFFAYTWVITFLSLIAVTKAIPHLMTQDLSSKALIIYTSKAINKWDYIIGKIGAMFLILCILWIIPCMMAWFISNAFAPRWHFFWHSREALVHSSVFLTTATVCTSIVALAFAAISSNSRTTTSFWITYWIIGWVAEGIAMRSYPFRWMKFLSLRYDLSQLQQGIFNLSGYYDRLIKEVPGLEKILKSNFRLEPSHMVDAGFAVIVICIVALLFISRRVDSES